MKVDLEGRFILALRMAFGIFAMATSSVVFGQSGSISGQVWDRRAENGLPFASVILVGSSIGATTDSTGHFAIRDIEPGIYDVRASFVGYGDTTVVGISVTADSAERMEFVLPPPCVYDGHRKDGICPFCKKNDKVIPIEYGLMIGKRRFKSDQGEFYIGGCTITPCDPNWYCRRDKEKF